MLSTWVTHKKEIRETKKNIYIYSEEVLIFYCYLIACYVVLDEHNEEYCSNVYFISAKELHNKY